MHYNFDQIIDRRGTNSVKWDEVRDPEMLPLWVADMDFATAPCVQEAIVRRAAHPCYGYVHVPDAYYQAIVDWFAARHQWDIEKEEILYTIGVIPAIGAILKGLCQTGDNIVLLTPVYNHFYSLVREAGCQAIEVELQSRPLGNGMLGFDIDFEQLEEALRQEKSTILLFCNPHNPAGRIWSEEEIRQVLALCHKHHVTVISDEIHNEITAPDRLYQPLAPVASRYNQELTAQGDCPQPYIICTSPSKSFNIAGLQNAFIVCPDRELRRRIDRAINLNEVCDVNPFGVEALIAAYSEGGEWLDEMRTYVYRNYDFACQFLRQELPQFQIADMQGTYLMWVNVSETLQQRQTTVEDLCRQLMIDQKVWFCPGSMYGKGGENYIRINLACPRATLQEALLRLAAGIKQQG